MVARVVDDPLARASLPVQALETVPQVPSGLHRRFGLPVYVSSQDVTVTFTATEDAAVIGHDAWPSIAPEAVGLQKTSEDQQLTNQQCVSPRPTPVSERLERK